MKTHAFGLKAVMLAVLTVLAVGPAAAITCSSSPPIDKVEEPSLCYHIKPGDTVTFTEGAFDQDSYTDPSSQSADCCGVLSFSIGSDFTGTNSRTAYLTGPPASKEYLEDFSATFNNSGHYSYTLTVTDRGTPTGTGCPCAGSSETIDSPVTSSFTVWVDPPITLSLSASKTSTCVGSGVDITPTATDQDYDTTTSCDPSQVTLKDNPYLTLVYYVDSDPTPHSVSNDSPFTYTPLTEGVHTIKVVAADGTGNPAPYLSDTNVTQEITITALPTDCSAPPGSKPQSVGADTGAAGGSCPTCGGSGAGDLSTSAIAMTPRDGVAIPTLASSFAPYGGPCIPCMKNLAAVITGSGGVLPPPNPAPIMNKGCGGSVCITIGGSSITTSGGSVLVDSVQLPGWSWNSTSLTLTAPDGSTWVFYSNGTLHTQSGPGGLGTITYTYDTTYQDRVTSVQDSYHNTWQYGVDPTLPGPSYVIDPSGTHKLTFSYVAQGSNGAGWYSEVKLYDMVSSSWTLRTTADYSYTGNTENKLSGVTITQAADPSEPEETDISYYPGTKRGSSDQLTDPVEEIYSSTSKLDVVYDYFDTTIGTNTYGTTDVRRRATYGTSDDTKDQVTDLDYYQDSGYTPNECTYLFRQVQKAYISGSLQNYATTEYRVYGYLARFAGSPTDSAVLKGQPWEVVDPNSKTTTFHYSTDNALVTQIDPPSGSSIYYTYVQSGGVNTAYLDTVEDSRGKYVKYLREDTPAALVTGLEISDDGTTWTRVQTTDYYLASLSDPVQEDGLVKDVIVPSIGDGDDTITYSYGESIGGTTTYLPDPYTVQYDGRSSGSYVTATFTNHHLASGAVSWMQDALGNATYDSYDTQGRLIQTILPNDPSQSGTVGSYTSSTITDTSKSWVTDELKGMTLQISGVGFFDITGNTLDVITVSGTIGSGASGASYWCKPYVTTQYSSCCGEVTKEKDERGNYDYYAYDSYKRLTDVRNAVTTSGSTDPLVHYDYNDLGQTTDTITYTADGSAARTTNYTYDQLGRITEIDYPSGTVWSDYYEYDTVGNLVAKLEGTVSSGTITAGAVTAYAYDSLNRLTDVKYNYSATTWPISSISISSPDVSYSYDGGSDLKTQMVDSAGTSGYTYDTVGRLETYSPPIPANYSVAYSYDNAGDKTEVKVSLSGTDKYKTDYGYYKNGWLKQVTAYQNSSGWVQKAQVNFDYDKDGNRLTVNNNGSGVQSTLAYNARGDTKSIDHKSSGGTELYGLTYHRDAAGNPLEVAFSGSQVPSPYTSTDATYSYDGLNRLKTESYPGVSNSWSYDWVGNRQDSGWLYNAVDELNAGSGYAYDMKGALNYDPSSTGDPRIHYQYSSDDVMDEIDKEGTSPQNETTMLWDADQQRLKLTEDVTNTSWQELYDSASYNPAVLVERHADSSNTTLSVTYDVREPDGELLASFPDGGAAQYYHFDDLGSTVMLSDGSGSPTSAYAYGAWGSVLNSPAITQAYEYVGRLGYYTHSSSQGSEASNWLESGVRFYNPTLGRFERRDPDKPRVETYAYVADDTLAAVDPWGLEAQLKPLPPPLEEEVTSSCSIGSGLESAFGAAIGVLARIVAPVVTLTLTAATPAGETTEQLRDECQADWLKCREKVDRIEKGAKSSRLSQQERDNWIRALYGQCTACLEACITRANEGKEEPWPYKGDKRCNFPNWHKLPEKGGHPGF